MKKLVIEIEGDCTDSLCNAIREVERVVGEGYTSGFNGNETDRYRFDISEIND